jgi:hypothetical protein
LTALSQIKSWLVSLSSHGLCEQVLFHVSFGQTQTSQKNIDWWEDLNHGPLGQDDNKTEQF